MLLESKFNEDFAVRFGGSSLGDITTTGLDYYNL